MTQTSLPVILAGSSLYPFVLMSLRTAIYIGWGAVLFGFPLQGANWLGALLVLGASVLAFSGLGILSASYLLIFKRGNPVNWAILGLSSVVGGMMYPISVLPVWLQYVARLIPVTYSLEGMRAAILGHASTRELLPSIAGLLLFAALLLPISFRDFFLGPAANEDYRHAHPFLGTRHALYVAGKEHVAVDKPSPLTVQFKSIELESSFQWPRRVKESQPSSFRPFMPAQTFGRLLRQD